KAARSKATTRSESASCRPRPHHPASSPRTTETGDRHRGGSAASTPSDPEGNRGGGPARRSRDLTSSSRARHCAAVEEELPVTCAAVSVEKDLPPSRRSCQHLAGLTPVECKSNMNPSAFQAACRPRGIF